MTRTARLLFPLLLLTGAPAEDRPRLCVLTDIGGDPDDTQSLILADGLRRIVSDRGPDRQCLGHRGRVEGSRHSAGSETGWKELTTRFRVYNINDQDSIADWIRGEFPGLHYILLPPTAERHPRDTVNRWRPAFQADFARRMAWCVPAE